MIGILEKTVTPAMNAVRKILLFIVVMLMPATILGQTDDVFVHFDGKSIHVRWRGERSISDPKYIVYRTTGRFGNKASIATTTRTSLVSDITKIAGTKTDAYLGMFRTNGKDITATDYERVFTNKTSLNLFNALSATTPEFARVLGEAITDSTFTKGEQYRYTIVVLEGSNEKIIGTSRIVSTDKPEVVPVPTDCNISSGDASCTITWQGNNTYEQQGLVVSSNVYRSEQPLGPFIRINALPLVPFRFTGNEQQRTFSDEYLQNGTTYFYYVTNINVAGVESKPSITLQATPGSIVGAPVQLTLQQIGNAVLVEWTLPTADASVRYYEVRRTDFKKVTTTETVPAGNGKKTSWIDNTVTSGAYTYSVRAVSNDTTSGYSAEETITLKDNIPPAQPQKLTYKTDKNKVILSWIPNKEQDIAGYIITRLSDKEFAIPFQLTASPIKATIFTDSLPPDAPYTVAYQIYAEDISYNRSLPSEKLFVRLPDKTPPTVPVITSFQQSKNSATINWTKSTEPDLKEFVVYRRTKNDTKAIYKTTTTTFTDKELSAGEYWYSVTATDSTGNESTHSGERSATILSSIIAPPEQGNATEKNGNIILSWKPTPSTDVSGYSVWIEYNGKQVSIKETKKTVTQHTDKLSDTTKEQTYYIRAFTSTGVESIPLTIRYTPKR